MSMTTGGPSRSGLIDDLDEDALSVLHAGGLHDTAQRLGRATLSPDHLPEVLFGDAQLENDGFLVILVLADLDLIGLVDQRLGEELEQLLQAIPFAFRRRLTVALGWAPWLSQLRTRSSSISIVEGSVCGL
jgi:hypothetical protein